MILKNLIDEDFVNYRKPSMFLIFPHCSFKCDKENGCQLCQNMPIIKEPDIEISVEKIYKRYIENPITKAIVCGGLEPFDDFNELYNLVSYFRENSCNDDFVIYTGYTESETMNNENWAKITKLGNIIIKFGRFRPNNAPHTDEVLGIKLASDNQYAKKFT